MTQAVREAEHRGPGKGGGSSGSILGTIRGVAGTLLSHWKLLVPLWLVLSALLVALIFLLPKEYGKNLTLAVNSTQTDLQARLAQPPLDPVRAKNQAVDFLEQADFGPARVSPEYDPARPAQPVRVRLESRNRQAVNGAAEEVVTVVEEGFQGTYEASLGTAVERQLATLNTQINAQEESLIGLDEAIAATRPAGPDDVENVVRLTVLESKRQDVLNVITVTEAQKEPFEEARQNLPRVAAEPVAVEVASESPVQQNNPRGPAAAFAVLLGLVAASVAVLWVAVRRRRRSVG